MIAKVIIDISHHAVDQTYDYLVPPHLETTIQKGMRVEVPFSKGIRTGLVTGFKKTSSQNPLKTLRHLLDERPILNESLLEVALVLKNKYAVPLFEIIHLLIPDFKRLKKTKYLRLIHTKPEYVSFFNDQKMVKYPKKLPDIIQQGLKHNDIEIHFSYQEKGSLKKDTYYQFNQALPTQNTAQLWLLETLKTHGPKTKKALKKSPHFSESSLQTLIKKNMVTAFEVPRYLTKSFRSSVSKKIPTQEYKILDKVHADLMAKTYVSLTASYQETLLKSLIQLLNRYQDQKVLLVYPEILMVENVARQLNDYLHVTVYHSKMTPSEKKDSYARFLNGAVMITTPTGFYLDLEATDLIIVNDCHHSGYQSLERPRFDIIEDGLYLKSVFDFKLLFMSVALPPVLCSNPSQVHVMDEKTNVSTTIQPVDLKSHVVKHPNALITEDLELEIKHALRHHQTTLLIHHQTGSYKHLKCFTCGTFLRCQRCHQLAQIKNDQPYCLSCQKPVEKTLCETCQTPYQNVDPGLDILKQEVNDTFHIVPATVTSTSDTNLSHMDALPPIIIGTKVLLHDFKIKNIGCIGFIQFDELVFKDAYMAAWKKATHLKEALALSTHPKTIVIQTYEPAARMIGDHASLDQFFIAELATFKKLSLKPTTDMVQIILRGEKNKRHYLGSHVLTYLKKALRDHASYYGPLHHLHDSIITIKSEDLKPFYKTFNTLYKRFSDDIELDLRHFNFRK